MAFSVSCTHARQTNVFLIGPMGSGKTAVGRHVARSLGLSFYDSDAEIERRTGVDIPFIFEKEGEAGFRLREREAIEALTALENIVLATGGGAVILPENRRHLAERGWVVYLRDLGRPAGAPHALRPQPAAARETDPPRGSASSWMPRAALRGDRRLHRQYRRPAGAARRREHPARACGACGLKDPPGSAQPRPRGRSRILSPDFALAAASCEPKWIL